MTLITRTHSAGGRISTATYSDCERYRYELTRTWDTGGKRLLIVMLNPSKATELANDPTIERCERRANSLGFGAFRVCNLFALRETDPARLKRAQQPEGPDNTAQIVDALRWCHSVLCAWGVHGAHLDQAAKLRPCFEKSEKPLLALGITKDGHPRHPLYVSYKTQPSPFTQGSQSQQSPAQSLTPERCQSP